MFADRQELPIDQFALYRVPLPKDFQSTKGKRAIKVSLAFDPPVRYSRLEYLGLRMNYHLLRGMTPEAIIQRFRHRNQDEAPFEDLPGTAKCSLSPSRDVRGTSTLQCSTFKMTRNVDRYGDDYYLAVFAERRWAGRSPIIASRWPLNWSMRPKSIFTISFECVFALDGREFRVFVVSFVQCIFRNEGSLSRSRRHP
jgi:hypothetical protein